MSDLDHAAIQLSIPYAGFFSTLLELSQLELKLRHFEL
jgi:hypothetical protein